MLTARQRLVVNSTASIIEPLHAYELLIFLSGSMDMERLIDESGWSKTSRDIFALTNERLRTSSWILMVNQQLIEPSMRRLCT